jgi:hypothetical protein
MEVEATGRAGNTVQTSPSSTVAPRSIPPHPAVHARTSHFEYIKMALRFESEDALPGRLKVLEIVKTLVKVEELVIAW